MICERIAKPATSRLLGDGRRMQRAMPDVGDIAGEECPGLAPVGAVVVQNLAGPAGRGAPPCSARTVRTPPHRADRSPSAVGSVAETRSTSVATVKSPQSSRCGPSSQRSPGRLTGSSGVSGISSSPSRASLRRRGPREQPVQVAVVEAGQRRGRSPRPAGRRARAQAAPRPIRRSRWPGCPSAGRLCACAGVSPRAMCTGAVFMPSCRAASSRVCPARITISSSTTIGWRQPNSLSETATVATALSFFRGLRA